MARRLMLGALAITALLDAGCADDEASPGTDALCEQVVRQGELRAADTTDEGAIAQLVAELPADYRVDAALFYWPYGGAIPKGTDTSGSAASDAGERLYALYREACDYDGA